MHQAGQAAERALIPPIPRPCSLAPSLTTPLYSISVSQTLRRTLRASFSEGRSTDPTKIHLPIGKRCMLIFEKPQQILQWGVRSQGSGPHFH